MFFNARSAGRGSYENENLLRRCGEWTHKETNDGLRKEVLVERLHGEAPLHSIKPLAGLGPGPQHKMHKERVRGPETAALTSTPTDVIIMILTWP